MSTVDAARVSDSPTFQPLPADGVYSAAWLNGLFAGNQQGFASHLARLATAAVGDARDAADSEPLAASAPRRLSQRQSQHNPNGSAYEHRRKIG